MDPVNKTNFLTACNGMSINISCHGCIEHVNRTTYVIFVPLYRLGFILFEPYLSVDSDFVYPGAGYVFAEQLSSGMLMQVNLVIDDLCLLHTFYYSLRSIISVSTRFTYYGSKGVNFSDLRTMCRIVVMLLLFVCLFVCLL